MDKIQFTALLKDHTLLDSLSENTLSDLVSRYPYAATLHLLRLKKAHQAGHDDVPNLLNQMSAFSPDRNTLYKVLHHRHKSNKSHLKPSEDSKQSSIHSQEASQPNGNPSEDIIKEPEVLESIKDTKDSNQSIDSFSKSSDEVFENEKVQKTTDKERTSKDISEDNEMIKNQHGVILLPAQAVFKLSKSTRSSHSSPNKEQEVHDHDANPLMSMNDLLQADANDDSEEKPFKLSRVPVFADDFLDFLDDTSQKVDNNESKDASDNTDHASALLKDDDDEEVPIADSNDVLGELDAIFQLFDTRKSSDTKNLIEDDEDTSWLQNTPSSDDIISHSLAQLFVDQGKIEEAIDMYRKLSLKFPEKSRLFADEIDKLNQRD